MIKSRDILISAGSTGLNIFDPMNGKLIKALIFSDKAFKRI